MQRRSHRGRTTGLCSVSDVNGRRIEPETHGLCGCREIETAALAPEYGGAGHRRGTCVCPVSGHCDSQVAAGGSGPCARVLMARRRVGGPAFVYLRSAFMPSHYASFSSPHTDMFCVTLRSLLHSGISDGHRPVHPLSRSVGRWRDGCPGGPTLSGTEAPKGGSWLLCGRALPNWRRPIGCTMKRL